MLPTYQYFKKGRDLYSMLLYGQHQSEVNSHSDGCPLKIPCATDAEVFVSLLRVTALFFFLSLNSDHRQIVHLIITHPDGAWSMQGDWPQA